MAVGSIRGQNTPDDDQTLIFKATKLYLAKDYQGSAKIYSSVFKLYRSDDTRSNRFNAACSWALAGFPDSAFLNLDHLSVIGGYANFGHIATEPDLNSLHKDKRWNPLMEAIKKDNQKDENDNILNPIYGNGNILNPSFGDRSNRLDKAGISKDSLRLNVKSDLEFIQLAKHEKVADIGSYDGYYPCIYSVFSDSITFYLNDTSKESLSKQGSICKLCSEKSGKTFSNEFYTVIGTDTTTNLPDRFFDKVIIRDALHHFKQKERMVSDIRRIMKPNASLYLFEPILHKDKEVKSMCRGVMEYDDLLRLFTDRGFRLVRSQSVESEQDLHWFEFKMK